MKNLDTNMNNNNGKNYDELDVSYSNYDHVKTTNIVLTRYENGVAIEQRELASFIGRHSKYDILNSFEDYYNDNHPDDILSNVRYK